MIYIYFENQDYEYQIHDILKLFFKDEEIVKISDMPKIKDGILFLCIGRTDNGYTKMQLMGEKINFSTTITVAQKMQENKHGMQKNINKDLKRQLYIALSEITGKKLPWGMLTGIRPVKIVHEMLREGMNNNEITKTLNDYYFVSPAKSNLANQIAQTEKNILDKTLPNSAGIYIGIPFCPSRCLYCSFTSEPVSRCQKRIKPYLDALRSEMDSVSKLIKENGYTIQSLYIGGGTPTSIDAASLKELLDYIDKVFDISCLEEYTIEAGRPDSINEEKLRAIISSKADRISINPQTMSDDTLRIIGRNHTSADIINSFNLARNMGFNNINMDVIIGLPGETPLMFENTLKQISMMGPESLTVHTMSVKRASRLNEYKEKYDLIEKSDAEQMIDIAVQYASMMNMHPYYLYRQKNMIGNLENIGYCKPGFESIYNIQIMEERQTIVALGAGAVTKVVYPWDNRIERAFNVKSIEEYIKRIDEMVSRKKELLEKLTYERGRI